MPIPGPEGKPPPVCHLLETSLYVADPAHAQAFYQRVFAFPLLFADRRLAALAVPGPAVLLLFRRASFQTPAKTVGGVIPPHGGAGHLHLCFAIAAADCASWDAHLSALAIPLESRVRWPRGGESLYFRDPDAHLIELATPGLWATY